MASLQLTDLNPVFLKTHTKKPARFVITRASSSSSSSPNDNNSSVSKTRRQLMAETAMAAVALAPLAMVKEAKADDFPSLSEWGRVYLPIDPGVVLLDIAFVPEEPAHGFLLGTRQTILETKDGGNTWAPRSIPSAEDEDFNYRFNSISFKGKEGWIVGKPTILLHTSNGERGRDLRLKGYWVIGFNLIIIGYSI